VNECIQVLIIPKEQDCFKSKVTSNLNSRSRKQDQEKDKAYFILLKESHIG